MNNEFQLSIGININTNINSFVEEVKQYFVAMKRLYFEWALLFKSRLSTVKKNKKKA